MPVWSTPDITEQPDIVLERWTVLELSDFSRHFVGWNSTDQEGRVSTDIIGFGPIARLGMTVSGRTYHLLGQPGTDSDSAYVLNRWLRINQLKVHRDVTAEY